METQFQKIVETARYYHSLERDEQKLYDALNNLEVDTLEDINEDYDVTDSKFQPVNLLRAEVVRALSNGEKVHSEFVEEIKENIRNKNLHFFSHCPQEYLNQLQNYRIGKRDMFANWQNPWSIFHTFFYRGVIKETTQQYLEQIGKQLLSDLDLPDYTYHWVDFYGASNFGSTECWIALYPEIKSSHRDAYQFFLSLNNNPGAGRMAGSSVRDPQPKQIQKIDTYTDALEGFNRIKEETLKLNFNLRNYFKFAPGPQASEWENLYKNEIVGLGYSDLNVGDISRLKSREEVNKAAGLKEDNLSNKTWNLWLFKNASIGDVVFAAKGLNTCLGIGIIDGPYYYEENPSGEILYSHRRKVKWITNKIYQYKSDTLKKYKNIFRPDAFSPTLIWQFLLNEYVRLYPDLADVFKSHNLPCEIAPEIGEKPETEIPEEEIREQNYWWLNANPAIWSLSELNEGDIASYTSRNEKGNKRRIYKHFESVQPGDLMFGYETSPVKQIKAIFEISKPLHTNDKGEEIIEFQMVEKLEVPVHWNELAGNPLLQYCEVFINNQGSLFKLTEEEYDVIREIIDNKNIIEQRRHLYGKIKKYIYADDPDKPFIEADEFGNIVALLKRKKNIILQGPPGVGKTFIARKLAFQMMGYENDAQIEMVQFHQSFSYEDFIQGIKPKRDGFEFKNGIFYTFCQRAHAHPDKPFFFIIDEINRGNLSKIFGELLMLIEPDKRKEKFALKLTYAEDEADKFFVPENLYIIGTMNTADRSLAIVDYALRRRFAFITLKPNFGHVFENFLKLKGISGTLINHILQAVSVINDQIRKDQNLGSGFEIGHSYFCTKRDGQDEKEWYNNVIRFEIKPLLEEIWFDDLEKAEKMSKELQME